MSHEASTPLHNDNRQEERSALSRQTLTVEEFAVLAGIGRSTAYEAARRGEIPARRIGKRFVIPIVLARAWLGELDLTDDPVPAHWHGSATRDDWAESIHGPA